MLTNVFEKIKSKFTYIWIIYFFIGFVALNFTNNIFVFISLSIVANLIVFIFAKRKLFLINILTLLLGIIFLADFSVFSMTSAFNQDPNVNISVAKYVFLILGVISIPFLGMQLRENSDFDIKVALKAIYICLAIWMAINFLITLIEYGPFYTFIYADKYFFDYGHFGQLPINKSAYMLLGFKVEAVTVEFFAMFASILSSAILGPFFISYKEDKRSFFEYLVCGSIGLLCVILTLNKSLVLGYLVLIIGFTLIVLFGKKILKFNKPVKIVTFSLAGIAALLFIIFMLTALNVRPLSDAIENNDFLSRLFIHNRVVSKYFYLVRAMSEGGYYRGFTGYLIGQDNLALSGSWLFDMFAIAQIYGWLGFIIFVVLYVVRSKYYLQESSDEKSSKIMVFGISLIFLLFTLVCYNSMPYFTESTYVPFTLTAPFVILLFLFGYMGHYEEEETNEK